MLESVEGSERRESREREVRCSRYSAAEDSSSEDEEDEARLSSSGKDAESMSEDDILPTTRYFSQAKLKRTCTEAYLPSVRVSEEMKR